MIKSKSTIMKRGFIYSAIGVAVVLGMVFMPFLVKPALADEVCEPEKVPDTSGKADYVYKLDTDCTLYIGPTNIPSRNEPSPIQQHDKVRKIVFESPEQTSLNEDSSYLFYGYPNVKSIEGIDKLDVSHVMEFESAFAGLNLEDPVDLSSWNMKTAYNFRYMFQSSNLDGFKGIDNFTFDLSDKVQPFSRDFQAMFKDTTSTKGIDLSEWTFLNPNYSENGLTLGQMFDGARTPKIDVSSFSGLNIKSSDRMFANTNTDIEGLDRLPTQNLIDASNMFENMKPTNQIDLSSWNTENLDSAESMFNGSDIDKFIGLDKWNLNSLTNSRTMYANLHPSNQVKIQTNLPNLQDASEMFSNSDTDMFTDIGNLKTTPKNSPTVYPTMMVNMFENAKATYLNMSNWKNDPETIIQGMLASPNIKYATFGNKTVGPDYSNNLLANSGSELFYGSYQGPNGEQSMNVWDRPDLPKEYSAKKWATLPIKQECDAKFDGNPNDLPQNCWDESQLWVSDKTDKEADDELLNNTAKHYQRIFFRAPSVPVSFNANGIENAQDMPNIQYFLKVFTKNDDVIPNNVPKDPSNIKVFESWNTQADGKGKTYQPGDHTGLDFQSLGLYAQWKDKAPNVQFNNNGGKGTTPETKLSSDDNTKIAVDCANTPSRDGSTFIGWSKTKNGVLEGHDAGDKGKIDVCGYSDNKTVKGLAGRTIDLYATWAKNPKAVFNENRPKDMTALLPATKTITGNWVIDDSTPKTYIAPNIEGWNKGYTPDGVYRFDGWMNEDGSPFTGAYLERSDIIINAKWSRIKSAAVSNQDNDQDHNGDHDQTTHDNGNSGDTTDDNANHEDNKENGNDNSQDSDTAANQQRKPGMVPVTDNGNDSSALFDPTSESQLNASGESSNGNESRYVTDSDTGSPSSQPADTGGNNSLAKTGTSIIAPIVLAIAFIISAAAAILLGRARNGRQQ